MRPWPSPLPRSQRHEALKSLALAAIKQKVPDLDRMLHDPKAQCGDVVEFILSS